ncbi:MAG: helix-turn-helix transcriptional regulator [Oscillospiraceae bacterium]|jgi:DNA-binding Xre family transcriptional regulator|nr:helix-turn-helix transcriptional regulator [Oscillospiraceae bacterium]
MATSYNKLFKLLIDKKIKKGELCLASGVSKTTLAKLAAGQNVSVNILEKICAALNCNFDDIMDYLPDSNAPSEE